jgi:hypothetical protein
MTIALSYEELYDSKWDPITLMIKALYTLTYKGFFIFWPDDGLPRPKLVAKTNKM